MSRIKVGHFLGDGGVVNLPIGFIPDYFRLCDIDSTVTNAAVAIHEWFRDMESHEASGSQEGWALGLATLGYTTLHADDAGISAYNSGSQSPTINEWTQARSTAATARTATAAGTYIKPTVGADSDTGTADRDAVYECVTAGTGGSTEPTWPTSDGEQVTDGTTVWEKVNVSKVRTGYQGVVIEDDIQTDSHEYYYLAIMADESVDHGDVDGWASGVYSPA